MHPSRCNMKKYGNVLEGTFPVSAACTESARIDCASGAIFFVFARHGRALTGASPEYTQIVGSI